MLGHTIADPQGLEGAAGTTKGLGLLNIATTLIDNKRLAEITGTERTTLTAVRGYEMHIGRTSGPDTGRPMLDLNGRPDGAISPDGKVMGCYLHGLFAADPFRFAFLDQVRSGAVAAIAYENRIERTLDALAEHLEQHIAIDMLLAIAGLQKAATTR